jgi:D-3-phosphoglycerate dehydrogenase
VKITAEALAGNRRLKAIVRAGVGTDNIDKNAATRLGIVVMNTPTGNTLSTAEHTIAMMLALSRNIAPAYQSLIEGRWERNAYMGTQLADKTLGIVGWAIGQAVASRASPRDARLGLRPFLQRSGPELGIESFPRSARCSWLTISPSIRRSPTRPKLIGANEIPPCNAACG